MPETSGEVMYISLIKTSVLGKAKSGRDTLGGSRVELKENFWVNHSTLSEIDAST